MSEKLGLENDRVNLVAHQTVWHELFLEEQIGLCEALVDAAPEVQHIGSTAVPGLSAKPILDIGVAVGDFNEAFGLIKPLEALGYDYRGDKGVASRHLFVKGPPSRRTHHLHVTKQKDDEWRKLLFFRDYLRVHPEKVTAYEALKSQLTERFSKNREAYTGGKHAFIQNILNRA